MRWSFALGLVLAALTVGCSKGGYGDWSSSYSGFSDTGSSSSSDDDDDPGPPPADDFDDGGFEEPGFEDDFDDYYDDGF